MKSTIIKKDVEIQKLKNGLNDANGSNFNTPTSYSIKDKSIAAILNLKCPAEFRYNSQFIH